MRKALILTLVLLVIPFSFLVLKKYQEGKPAPPDSVALEFPLKNGKFFVTISGKFMGRHSLPIEKYALDIIKYPTLSSLVKFRQTSLDADPTYGTSIYSPCIGKVKSVRDGVADQPIGIKNTKVPAGNMVIVACDGFNVMMAHFKTNSIKVRLGDRVEAGEELGQLGNSGNTDGPHLHFMAYLSNDQTGEVTPLPMSFGDRYLHTWDSLAN